MPFFINRNFENQLYDLFSSMQAWMNGRPLNLGGMSGPGGGYGGYYIGQLPQSRVAYDTTESSSYDIPASGTSMLHNLNRIRHRITDLEIASGVYTGVSVQHDDSLIGSGITILNFEGYVDVQKISDKVTITISGGGGATAGNSVTSGIDFSQSTAVGTGSSYSRVDHSHGTPYQPSREIVFTAPDTLEIGAGSLRIYNQLGINFHASKVFLAVSTPPVTSDAIIIDINKNGATIFSAQENRPQITSGNYTGYTTTINTPDFNDGDYYTVDIDQVGSGGSFLTTHIKLVDTLV